MHVVTVTPALIELLRERRVSTSMNGADRFRTGQRMRFVADVEIEPYSHLFAGINLPARLGAFSYAACELSPWMRVGRYCSIATSVEVLHTEHPSDWVSSSPFSYDPRSLPGLSRYMLDRGLPGYPLQPGEQFQRPAVEVGHDVWIAQGAVLKGGVTIGHGAIVGARALVTRDVPPYAVVTGQPARVRRLRFAEPLIERLLALRWWRFGPELVQSLDVADPEGFVGRLEARLANEPPPELAFEPLRASEIIAAAAQP